jgi:hypothetical protein
MKKKVLFWIIFILIVAVAGTAYWKYGFTYSEGYRAGLLQKFSLKGAIFKTYEGEMILSSVESSDRTTLASEKFFFSVVDTDVAKSMEKIQGEHVVVHYKQKNGALMWRGDSPYIVDSVRVSEEPFRKK